eukprot:gb/GFBE01065605.1/.p1 GENE.gb/GFBE01065605.1/~~gb/GFBE01065605.1/.p1  ORF type:complete len:622 (+),score=141.29 gb/GFBE01065605.1/:1-1866(+)
MPGKALMVQPPVIQTVIQDDKPAVDVYQCPKGHKLSTLGLPYLGVTCHVCGCYISPQNCLHSCNTCKYDVCSECLKPAIETARSIPQCPRCPGCRVPMEWSNYSLDSYVSGWTCVDQCGGRRSNRGAWRWFCMTCSKDICQKCLPTRLQYDQAGGCLDSPRSLRLGHEFLDLCQQHKWENVKAYVEQKPALINCNVNGRWTALHQAARAGKETMVRYLLDLGADCQAQASDGKTPLEVVKGERARSLMIGKCYLEPASTVFKYYDANDSGGIDAAELGWVMKSLSPDLTDAQVAELFDDGDLDKDGEVDYVEFVQWLYVGKGRMLSTEILAAAESIAASNLLLGNEKNSEEDRQLEQSSLQVRSRANVDDDNVQATEYVYLFNYVGMPPDDMKSCAEHIREIYHFLAKAGMQHLETTLAQVDVIAKSKRGSIGADQIKDMEMLYALVLLTFDLGQVLAKDDFKEDGSFRFAFNRLLRERDPDLMQEGHLYLYYLMTGLSRVPSSGGAVYQGMEESQMEQALEVLREGSQHYWPCFTFAERLFKDMQKYREGMVLRINLLGSGSRSRDISQLSALCDTHEVLLLPNFRFQVGNISFKKGIKILELNEIMEDYTTTLRAEDFE